MKHNFVKGILVLLSVAFLVTMLVLPLSTVLVYSLHQGWHTFYHAVTDDYTVKALNLTLLATGITIVVNTLFGESRYSLP